MLAPKKPPSRRRPSKKLVRELRDRATESSDAELEQWLRDVRPAVRHAGRLELEHRGLRKEADRLGI